MPLTHQSRTHMSPSFMFWFVFSTGSQIISASPAGDAVKLIKRTLCTGGLFNCVCPAPYMVY